MSSDAPRAAAESVAHLQGAAREMLAAARTFLDAIEEVVNDDERVTRIVDGLTDVVRYATETVSHVGSRTTSEPAAKVRHIVVE